MSGKDLTRPWFVMRMLRTSSPADEKCLCSTQGLTHCSLRLSLPRDATGTVEACHYSGPAMLSPTTGGPEWHQQCQPLLLCPLLWLFMPQPHLSAPLAVLTLARLQAIHTSYTLVRVKFWTHLETMWMVKGETVLKWLCVFESERFSGALSMTPITTHSRDLKRQVWGLLVDFSFLTLTLLAYWYIFILSTCRGSVNVSSFGKQWIDSSWTGRQSVILLSVRNSKHRTIGEHEEKMHS